MRILARMLDLDLHANALADGIVAALPRWVERSVDRIYRAWAGPPPPAVVEAAQRAGRVAAEDVGARVRDLLAADVDAQRSTPLTLVREAVVYPTTVLADARVAPVVRDDSDQAMFPEDTYGLTPANFADLDPALADVGLRWGAAKAWVHRERHRPTSQ